MQRKKGLFLKGEHVVQQLQGDPAVTAAGVPGAALIPGDHAVQNGFVFLVDLGPAALRRDHVPPEDLDPGAHVVKLLLKEGIAAEADGLLVNEELLLLAEIHQSQKTSS